jgi:hypothetical protein
MNIFPRYSLVLVGSVAAIAVPLAFAGKPVPAPPPANVTTIIHDEDAALNQFLLRSDDYNGSFQASYNGGMSVTNSGWSLELYTQSVRTVWLTLSKPVGNSPADLGLDGYYSADVQLFSRCYDINNQQLPISNLAMAPGTANTRCDLGVVFLNGKTKYELRMSPTIAGTGWATVSCNTADSTGACNSWTISPNTVSGNGNVPTVANLYAYGPRGLGYIGSYYNTYRIDVTHP